MKKLDLSALCENTVIHMVKSHLDHFRTDKFYVRKGNMITAINPGKFASWCRENNVNYRRLMVLRSNHPEREIRLTSCSGAIKNATLLPKTLSL